MKTARILLKAVAITLAAGLVSLQTGAAEQALDFTASAPDAG